MSDCTRQVDTLVISNGNNFASSSNAVAEIAHSAKKSQASSELMQAGWNADNDHCAPGREGFQSSLKLPNRIIINRNQRTDGFHTGLLAGGILIIGFAVLSMAMMKQK
jgi:hypothetical protein